MSGAFSIALVGVAGAITLSFPGAVSAPIELTPIYRGMQGPPGEGAADIEEMPDLSLLFENQLI